MYNVCEIKFARRIPKIGAPPFRRMLCTNCLLLLNSPQGRTALNYRPARSAPKFNPALKNLIITWDLFMQDYRCVSMDQCELITMMPANHMFWKYFKERLVLMSMAEKIQFMQV